MKKWLFSILLFLFISPFVVNAQSVSGEQISDFNSRIQINKDGTIDVSEVITYSFATYKHGIYRTIPIIKTNTQGKKFELSISNIAVSLDNKAIQFSQSVSDDSLRLKIGDPAKTITGQHLYTIAYKVSGALTYFSDHDELYWNVTGNDWPIPIPRITSEMMLPVTVGQNEVQGLCYTGYRGSNQQECQVEPLANGVKFVRENILYSGEGLTTVVSFPKNLVAVLEPKEYVEFRDTLLGKIFLYLVLGGSIVLLILWYLIYPLWLPVKWYLAGRDPNVGGAVRAWYDPPKTKTGRVLTPAETGALFDERADLRDILATIIDLARRGHLKIIEKKKGDFSFEKQKEFKDDSSLQQFEKILLSELFKNGKTTRLKDRQLYTPMEDIKKLIYTHLVEEGFFPKDPSKTRNFYSGIAIAGIFTLNIPLVFFSLIFGRAMFRRTLFGSQQRNVAVGLQRFLSSQERQLNFQSKNQMFFEKLLPYAVAFGVEKIWAQRFKDINLTPPDWYEGSPGFTFSSIYLANSLHSSYNSFQSSSTPTRSSSGFSSGFSGGGFSGGGGGGGGGGSW